MQSQAEVKRDLKRLEETLKNATKIEARSYCESLCNKYNSDIIWLKEK